MNVEGEDMTLRKLAAVLPIEAKPAAAEILLQKPTPKRARKAGLMQSLLTLNKPRPKARPLVKTPPKIPALQSPLPKPAPQPAAVPPKP